MSCSDDGKAFSAVAWKAPDAPLIRRMIKTKRVEKNHESIGVSYSTVRAEFKKFLSPLVENTDAFGLHSIKSGAASNAGCRSISAELLDKHAGWKCVSSKFRYIKHSAKDMLEVTKALGL